MVLKFTYPKENDFQKTFENIDPVFARSLEKVTNFTSFFVLRLGTLTQEIPYSNQNVSSFLCSKILCEIVKDFLKQNSFDFPETALPNKEDSFKASLQSPLNFSLSLYF